MKTPPDLPRLALAEEYAQNLLLRERITKPPVPVKELLDQYAIVCPFEHPSELSFCLEQDSIWYVFINSKISEHSVSFIRAYEMGHLFLNHLRFDPSDLTASQFSAMKLEADHFANNLLIPEDWIRLLCLGNFVNESDVDELAKLFSVTPATLVKRLLALQINCGFDAQNWLSLHEQTPLRSRKKHSLSKTNLRQPEKMITTGIKE